MTLDDAQSAKTGIEDSRSTCMLPENNVEICRGMAVEGAPALELPVKP